VIELSQGQLSGDAGLLPVRPFDQSIGLTRAFADALDDPRDPDLSENTFWEMVWSRVYGILAGYEDQNDHDTPRHDPVFKLVSDRYPTIVTWPASRRCPAWRRLSPSSPLNTSATCSSTNSLPPSTRGES
jgi:hypothetical protein